MEITFTNVLGADDQFGPIPAIKLLPDWYKQTHEYLNNKKLVVNGHTPHTIKKCIPVFDAMNAGYILRTPVDVQVSKEEGSDLPYYQWPSLDAVAFHPVEQAPLHPSQNGAPYPKWMNPWAVSTPRGWSCLFIPPMHNPNGIFTILPGLVDTDTYTNAVNFPFTLDDVTWEGLIPAGTPMVQVIPIHRESWKMRIGGDKERVAQGKVTGRLRALWFNSYKRQFWSRKEYR